ncbi:MAG: hypothetical protein L6R42_000572 [Xanthoria sp. 1 TBL-2021]|nr:MAG: hypothetical protein L6R42_000572 [Xanthoria sp. 1 TBL-2021]
MTPSYDTENILEKLPNEIVATILASLPRRHLKQARLASTRLAVLGARLLIDTVYISSREKDMAVFDSITQHPVFSTTVSNIVFDNAQFANIPENEYFTRLYEQMSHPQIRRLMDSNLAVRNLLELMTGEPFGAISSVPPIIYSASDFERCQHDEVFLEGFRMYSAHAREQKNVLDLAWFARALDGFNRLGSIKSVLVGTTFNGTFFVHDRDYEIEDAGSNNQTSVDKDVDNGTASEIQLALAHFEGRSLTGSPVARTWPPTALIPVPPWYHQRNSAPQALRDSWTSNGCIEFLKLVQLLRWASKKPLEFDAAGGVPANIFDLDHLPEPANLQVFSQRLKILRLGMTLCSETQGDTVHRYPQLHTIKSLMHDLPTLEELNLGFPVVQDWNESSMYDFPQVFPPVTEWRLGRLKELILLGLSFSYRDLAGFLFLVLPKLCTLYLGNVLLKDGAWDDFVEWLRHYHTPSFCLLDKNLLYPQCRVYYSPGEEVEVDSEEHTAFCNSVSDYIRDGGRHPGLEQDNDMSHSRKFLARMKATIEDLRAASKCSKRL